MRIRPQLVLYDLEEIFAHVRPISAQVMSGCTCDMQDIMADSLSKENRKIRR